jgi:hypothetical protein
MQAIEISRYNSKNPHKLGKQLKGLQDKYGQGITHNSANPPMVGIGDRLEFH